MLSVGRVWCCGAGGSVGLSGSAGGSPLCIDSGSGFSFQDQEGRSLNARMRGGGGALESEARQGQRAPTVLHRLASETEALPSLP